MPLDSLFQRPIASYGQTASEDIQHAIETPCRELPFPIRIDQIKPNETDIGPLIKEIKGSNDASIYKVCVRIQNQEKFTSRS